jgi:hypothetical protein
LISDDVVIPVDAVTSVQHDRDDLVLFAHLTEHDVATAAVPAAG